jgi:hypothetical protein
MIIKINIKALSWAAFVIAISVLVAYFIFANHTESNSVQLPADVAYALEYFNAVSSNKTLIVPSIYYDQAVGYAINNNKIIENDSEYANILFENKSYSGINYVLIDMGQLNYLQKLYEAIGLAVPYNITILAPDYRLQNLSQSARECLDYYTNSTNWFAFCESYVNVTIKNPLNPSQNLSAMIALGHVSLGMFPKYTGLLVINASIFYNGINMEYFPSSISKNNSNFQNGIAFVYENLTTFYLPSQIMNTFYGKNMFLPVNMSSGMLDSYGEARVVATK